MLVPIPVLNPSGEHGSPPATAAADALYSLSESMSRCVINA